MTKTIDQLVEALSGAEISKARSQAPEGYEDDFVRALAVKKWIESGNSGDELTPPPHWRSLFITLCYQTNLSPYRCAQLAGVTLSFIRLQLSRVSDETLMQALNIGRAANFERRIDEPTGSDLRSPAIPLAGLNALAGWTTKADSQRQAAEIEIQRITILRKRFNLELDSLDAQDSISVEIMRTAGRAGGVLGLSADDIDIDEGS